MSGTRKPLYTTPGKTCTPEYLAQERVRKFFAHYTSLNYLNERFRDCIVDARDRIIDAALLDRKRGSEGEIFPRQLRALDSLFGIYTGAPRELEHLGEVGRDWRGKQPYLSDETVEVAIRRLVQDGEVSGVVLELSVPGRAVDKLMVHKRIITLHQPLPGYPLLKWIRLVKEGDERLPESAKVK